MPYRVVIADDEPYARDYLRELLMKDSSITIVAELGNGRQTLDYVHKNNPDLLFLDIQMPGINGLEVAIDLAHNSSTIIIFCTAYDQFAVKAFETNALDYLLKPFAEDRLQSALERAKNQIELKEKAQFVEGVYELYDQHKHKSDDSLSHFLIKERGFERRISVDDIILIEASSVYQILHTLKRSFIYREALARLAKQLPADFLRVHRSFIVNTNKVQSIKYLNNNTYKLDMLGDKQVVSSRRYKPDLAQLMARKEKSR